MKDKRRYTRRNRQEEVSRSRRRKKDGYWIEDCPETSTVQELGLDVSDVATSTTAEAGASSVFTVWITRSEALDGHGRDDTKVSLEEAPVEEKDDGRPTAPPLDPAPRFDQVREAPDKASATHSHPQRKEESEAAIDGTGAHPSGGSSFSSSLQLPTLIAVRRAPSARLPRSSKLFYPVDPGFCHLPHGDNGDGIVNPHPSDVEDKFWAQRTRLFSRFDEGIQMDAESWYSVTPEAIANHHAQRMVSGRANGIVMNRDGVVIVDAFGGVGGNSIAFCLQGGVNQVVCVDSDESKLVMAANNCRIYGIPPQKVLFVHANGCHVLQAYENGHRTAPAARGSDTDAPRLLSKTVHGYTVTSSLDLLPPAIHGVFLSPPWGGTDVVQDAGRKGFSLESIQVDGGGSMEVDGGTVLRLAFGALPCGDKRVAYFLPRNTNGKKVAMSAIEAGFRGSLELEGNILNCKLKTITVYFGSLVAPS